MGRDPTTIHRFITKYKETGKIENLPQSGWPPVLNKEEKNALVTEASKQCCTPLHEIINNLNLNCSLTTAKKILYDAGIHSQIAAKKPFISEINAKKRISWCNENKKKFFYDWSQVIFSDEMSIEIGKQS
jgi:hypothetical protein